MNLAGKRVLITGAAAGAGRAIAVAFADAGARVVVSDISVEAVGEFARSRSDILAMVSDAGDEGAVAALAADATRHLGGIDVLVNNVGIGGPTAAAEDVTLAQWNETLQVNLTGHFLMARAVIPGMKARRGGVILNMSSMSARIGLPLRLPYVVSKAGVLSLTQGLARELGRFGIRVNAILPGTIEGERIRRVIAAKSAALGVSAEDYAKRMLRYVSMGTMVSPGDVAAMALFLASDAAARVTGQMIAVDGDMSYEP